MQFRRALPRLALSLPVENLYVAYLLFRYYRPIKFDEYLQCAAVCVLSYSKRLMHEIRLTLVLLKRYFFSQSRDTALT